MNQDARYICEGNTMYICKYIKMHGLYVKEKKYVLCVRVCMYVYLCLFVVLCVYCFFITLDAGLLARSQYSEGPATGHLDTGFSWFPCA